jgi:hypothetical protein
LRKVQEGQRGDLHLLFSALLQEQALRLLLPPLDVESIFYGIGADLAAGLGALFFIRRP